MRPRAPSGSGCCVRRTRDRNIRQLRSPDDRCGGSGHFGAGRLRRRAAGVCAIRGCAKGEATTLTLPASTARCQAAVRARQYIDEHLDRPLTLASVCQASYASPRALEYGFREIFGVSPIAYIRCARLSRVRRELYFSPYTSGRITQLAMKWGFWHLSQFSKDYYDLFGELPSITLGRASGRIGRRGCDLRGARGARRRGGGAVKVLIAMLLLAATGASFARDTPQTSTEQFMIRPRAPRGRAAFPRGGRDARDGRSIMRSGPSSKTPAPRSPSSSSCRTTMPIRSDGRLLTIRPAIP